MLKARQACRVYQNEVKKKEDDKVNNDGKNGVGVVNYTNAGDDRCDVGRGDDNNDDDEKDEDGQGEDDKDEDRWSR